MASSFDIKRAKLSLSKPLLLTVFTMLLLVKVADSDTCSFTENGSSFANSQHEIFTKGKCYPCQPQCASCSSISDKTCLYGNCAKYYYYDATTQTCNRCGTFCEQCTGPSVDQCTKCIDGYYFSSSLRQCQECQFGTKTCTSSISISCLDGMYFDSESLICRQCPSFCSSCTSSSQCLICDIGYFLSSNSRCVRCEDINCEKCVGTVGENCYDCNEGYYIDSSNNNLCSPFECADQNCVECLSSDSSSCSLCSSGYYLYSGSCHFGTSILCEVGEGGSSFGKCLTCSDVAYTDQSNFPTYCLPEIYEDSSMYDYEFKTFVDQTLCFGPEFLTSDGAKEHSVDFEIEPTFRIDLTVRMITSIELSSDVYFELFNSEGLGNFAEISVDSEADSSVNKDEFFCQSKNVINTDSLWVHIIKRSYKIKSLSSSLSVRISSSQTVSSNNSSTNLSNDTNGQNSSTSDSTVNNTSDLIYLSEVYLKKHLCQVSNCQACYSASLCASCQDGYFLENYQCKESCSVGYYVNHETLQCSFECEAGYFINFETSECQRCQQECSECSGTNQCQSCTDGYYLYQEVCLSYCPDTSTYPQQTTKQCTQCHSPCRTCENQGSNCTSCSMGYLYENGCVSQCPEGFLPDFSTPVPRCSECSDLCLQCELQSSTCSRCSYEMILFEGRCLYQCENGYFKQTSQQTIQNEVNGTQVIETIIQHECVPCLKNCLTCSSSMSNCTSCYEGYLLYLTEERLLEINQTIYNEEVSYLFELLSSTGSADPTSNQAGICLTLCPQIYFYTDADNLTCESCSENCVKCLSSTQCLECEPDSWKFLEDGVCRLACLDEGKMLYMSQTLMECIKCEHPCKTCMTDYEGTNCLSCTDKYSFLIVNNENLVGNCLLFCPEGFYRKESVEVNGTTYGGFCESCPPECSSCQNSSICLTCADMYILNEESQCIQESQAECLLEGYFLNQNLVCEMCSQTCKQCQGSSFFCTACFEGEYLLEDTGVCYIECPDGYFNEIQEITITMNNVTENQTQVTQVYSCEPCHQNCSSCQSLTLCTACKWSFFLLQGECLTECPSQFYPQINFSGSGGLCFSCPTNCLSCLNNLVCLECEASTVMIENECTSECLEGFYMIETASNSSNSSVSRECLECPEQCTSCINPSYCLSCANEYVLMNLTQTELASECIMECPLTFYYSVATDQCEPCSYPCLTCENQLVCLECQDNLTLVNQECVSECPNTFYLSTVMIDNNRVCISCPIQCYICTSSSNCIECSEQFYYLLNTQTNEGECLMECGSGYYENNITKTCEVCKKPCSTCDLSQGNCLSCVEKHYLRKDFCVALCPMGTYSSTADMTCIDCPNQCVSCHNQTYCSSCKSNYYLYASEDKDFEQRCLEQCPASTFLESSTQSCLSCYQDCLECQEDAYTCTSCPENTWLERSLCVSNCSQFYFLNDSSKTCDQCSQWCVQCTNHSLCLKCSYGYLFEGYCTLECPNGTFENSKYLRCDVCETGCLTCKDEVTCQRCDFNLGLALYATQCSPLPCGSNLYYLVDENQCVDRCSFLVNEKAKDCYQNNCPANYVLSQNGTNCLQVCGVNEFVVLDLIRNVPVCKLESEVASIWGDDILRNMPSFTLEASPTSEGLKVIVFFSYDALSNIEDQQQLLKSLKVTIEEIPEDRLFIEMGLWKSQISGNTEMSNDVNLPVSQSLINGDSSLRLLEESGSGSQIIEFESSLQAKTQNAAIINLIPSVAGLSSSLIKRHLKIGVNMSFPYINFTISPQSQGFEQLVSLPPQNYFQTISATTYSYTGYSPEDYEFLEIFGIFFICVCLVIYVLECYVNQKTKSYLYANTVQFMQLLFLLLLAPIAYPPVVESFLKGFSLISGRGLISDLLQQRKISENEPLIPSPWQYYKHTVDIDFFNNIGASLIVLAVLMGFLVIAKVLSLFPNPLQQFSEIKVLKNKVKLLEIYVWLFISYVGTFTLINLLYPQNSYSPQTVPFWTIMFYLCGAIVVGLLILMPIYVFYRQFDNKLKYDPGLDIEKKKIGVSIPLYQVIRKVLFVVFLVNYYYEAMFAICIHLECTGLIFILIYWYEPYRNSIRQKICLIQEGSLFVFGIEILALVLDQEYGIWIGFLIVIHAILHLILSIVYPVYCVYETLFNQNNPQEVMVLEDEATISEVSKNNKIEGVGKGLTEDKDSAFDGSQSTKLNFLQKVKGVTHSEKQSDAHEADQSEQGDEIRKKFITNVVRLAKKNTKRVKEFKNYAYSDESSEEQSQDSQTVQRKRNGQYEF